MKNKLFTLIALSLIAAHVNAQAPAELLGGPVDGATALQVFITMESKHKDDWFAHEKKIQDAKYDLLKNKHEEWVNFKIHSIQALEDTKNFSAPEKDRFFREQLKGAIALHKKQVDQFKKNCEGLYKEAKELEQKHEAELNNFIKNFVR